MSAEAERWREEEEDVVLYTESNRTRGVWMPQEQYDALAAAVEARDRENAHLTELALRRVEEVHARDRRIAELEAGLREIAEARLYGDRRPAETAEALRRIARDLLERRAAGGDG